MKENVKIAGLMYVKLQGEVRPYAVVHPDPRDVVAVGDEFAGLRSDDGGVGAVDTNAVEIIDQEFPGFCGGTQKEGEAILPEVSPAPSAPSVVKLRQKGAPEYFSQR